jgi:hypothetical protein
MKHLKSINENTTISNEDLELRSLINNIVYKRTSYIKNEFGGKERVIIEEESIKLIDDFFNILKKIKNNEKL